MKMKNNSEIKVDLSLYMDRFCDKDIVFYKGRPTFIYGRNGTGKSTITKAIESQYNADFDVRIFNDFENIAENKKLNAFTIGEENVEIQRDIDKIDAEIEKIEAEIENDPAKYKNNKYASFLKAKNDYEKLNIAVENFYTESAKEITQKCGLGRNYNKNNFKDDIIKNPKTLNVLEFKDYMILLKEDEKGLIPYVEKPTYNLSGMLSSVNEIIQQDVAQSIVIQELSNNNVKQNFARDGMRIHKPGDTCAFCGGIVSEERWGKLLAVFNEEAKKTESRIQKGLELVISCIGQIKGIKTIDPALFYASFQDNILNINKDINLKKHEIENFLLLLKEKLEEKQKSLFTKLEPLDVVIPDGFNTINKAIKNITEKANLFTKNIEMRKNNAKTTIRMHYVAKCLENYKYNENFDRLNILKAVQDQKEKEVNNIRDEIRGLKLKKSQLLQKTKNENNVVYKINNLLKQSGVMSFSLELVENNENQKGQYCVMGHDGRLRNVDELSKGEINIVAFLYFIFKLESDELSDKTKIIVFDDPMTSNDDSMQYLMTTELQRIYSKYNNDYVVILTHNCHFYLKVRKSQKKFYTKYLNYYLHSNGIKTTIKIINSGNDDFHTSYELLWLELRFLYDENKPELMIACCRRICETFQVFNGITDFYKETHRNAKDLFDINLHAIDDLSSNQNGKTKEEIINILKELFISNNAEEHFNKYWCDEINDSTEE